MMLLSWQGKGREGKESKERKEREAWNGRLPRVNDGNPGSITGVRILFWRGMGLETWESEVRVSEDRDGVGWEASKKAGGRRLKK